MMPKNRLSLLLLIILSSFTLHAQDLVPSVIRNHANGEAALIRYHRSGDTEKAVVKVERFNQEGLRTLEMNVRNGNPHGEVKGWNEKGKLIFEHQYAEGLAEGKQSGWDDKGRTQVYVLNFRKGKKNV